MQHREGEFQMATYARPIIDPRIIRCLSLQGSLALSHTWYILLVRDPIKLIYRVTIGGEEYHLRSFKLSDKESRNMV